MVICSAINTYGILLYENIFGKLRFCLSFSINFFLTSAQNHFGQHIFGENKLVVFFKDQQILNK